MDIGRLHEFTECAVSRKVAVVVMHGVACQFVCLKVLVVMYTANLLKLIGLFLPASLPQLFVHAIYNGARFQPIVIFFLKNVAMNHCT